MQITSTINATASVTKLARNLGIQRKKQPMIYSNHKFSYTVFGDKNICECHKNNATLLKIEIKNVYFSCITKICFKWKKKEHKFYKHDSFYLHQ